MPLANVHLNGSINLADTRTVFEEVTARVPMGLRRIPDGETGERSTWVTWQVSRFDESPDFERVATTNPPSARPRFRLVTENPDAELQWPDLGYRAAYADSYAEFISMRDSGVIPAGIRFQVQYPTPLAAVGSWLVPEDHLRVEASYAQALFADLQELLAVIPAEDLAVQWDVALEFAVIEGQFPSDPALDMGGLADRVARCVDQVPDGVPVGMHLCYGDSGHHHFVQPQSLQPQVQFANTVATKAARRVCFISFTVPQDRDNESYFAPLAGLQGTNELDLSFGIVPYHPQDQARGTTDRQVQQIEASLPPGTEWALGTECGMGRMGPDVVLRTLDLHREILQEYGAN